MKIRLAIQIAALLAAAPAAAEIDYDQRAGDLTALSRVFGELHNIRRTCEPRNESDTWRERMKTLVELEMPPADLREEMVSAFNNGFRSAEARFSYCDREARDHAAMIAARGDEIAKRLVEPLYQALTNSFEPPNVWVIGDEDSEQ